MTAFGYFAARLKEPSSWAGFGLLLQLAGLHPNDLQLAALVQALTAIAGAIAVFFPEAGAGGTR